MGEDKESGITDKRNDIMCTVWLCKSAVYSGESKDVEIVRLPLTADEAVAGGFVLIEFV